jgi:signal transduction histidine kinase
VSISHSDGRLVVEVEDDGRGGAEPGRGSGLRGLADRVEVLNGSISLQSPEGQGTRLRAEFDVT